MSVLLRVCFSLLILAPSLARAATLENPAPDSYQSGIGIISGWACDAGRIEIEFNDGPPVEAAYGTSRGDTQSRCGDADNGFGLPVNWNLLGHGSHTVRALADGVAFASVTVTVTTLGEEFLRGASGTYDISDFFPGGRSLNLTWQEAQQNFVLTDGSTPEGGGTSGSPPHILENPAPSSLQSGIGIISGWVCDADRIEIEFDDGAPVEAGYGTSRGDTHSTCGDTDNGFGLPVNWNLLGHGSHTVRALADGVAFASVTVHVTTLGQEFVRGVSQGYVLLDFPSEEETVTVEWQESQQNFVITAASPGSGGDGSGGSGEGDWIDVCDRTPEVRDRIMSYLVTTDCAAITAQVLGTITDFGIHQWIVTALKPGDFTGLTAMWRLLLDHNQLTTLPPGVFNGLTNLRTLTLTHNQLTTLPPDVFTGLAALEWLEVGHNQLTTLPPDVFTGLSNLTGLYLDHNQLTTLPSGVFNGLSNLRTLGLTHNQLTTLPPDVFTGLSNLQGLGLGNNQLTNLPAGVFADIPTGARIYLEGNPGYPFQTADDEDGDGGGGGGTEDCNNAWTGTSGDYQVISQCQAACVYAQAGQTQGKEAACSIVRQWERHYPGTVLRYCPVCQ